MTQSEQLAEKIKDHLLAGGLVRFGTCYKTAVLKAKHVPCVFGSKLETDRGIWLISGKTRVFWMEQHIKFSINVVVACKVCGTQEYISAKTLNEYGYCNFCCDGMARTKGD